MNFLKERNVTNTVQAIMVKNPCKANNILFEKLQRYNNEKKEPVDDSNEWDRPSKENENNTEPEENILDTRYALNQAKYVSSE